MSNVKRYSIIIATLFIVVALGLGAFFSGIIPGKAAGTPVVFRVNAAGDITANGTAIRVKGGSWFGLQGRHEPSTDSVNPSGAPLEQYIGNVFWASSSRTYTGDAAEFKAMGINVVRVPVSPQTLTGTDPQGMAPYLKNTASVVIPDSLTALKTVVQALDAQGIYVLLDIHSCSNYVDWRKGRLDARPPYVDATRDNYDFKREDSSCSATNNPSTVTRIQAYDTTKWIANLKQLAGFESAWGVSNIIGIDIFNEPWDYTWADWSSLISQAYTAINSVNPNILIFAEGISDTANNQDGTPTTITAVPTGAAPSPNWGGNLYEAGANPPAGVPKSMLVFSPHVYGISVFVGKQFVDNSVPACVGLSGDAAGDAKCPLLMPSAATLAQGWDAQWGYLKAQGYAVVIGEFGGNFSWPGGAASLRDQNRYSYVTDHTIDQKWQQAFVAYLHSKCINDTIYWSINPESGDTGGLYTSPYNAVSNTGGWGTWGGTDSAKLSMLSTLWNTAPGTTCGSVTPVPTTPVTPGVTPATATRTPVTPVGNTPTRTRTSTTGPSLTPTRTATIGTGPTVTRTNTPVVVATTAVPPTTPPGGACSPVTSTITAPYTFDGAATSCLQIATVPSYINSWNATTVSINGTVITNLYVAAGSLPAKISGNYYIKFVSTVAWAHIEIK
jgi:aryl-phospho-beta-D-glucosidase BglC (GH1 family)